MTTRRMTLKIMTSALISAGLLAGGMAKSHGKASSDDQTIRAQDKARLDAVLGFVENALQKSRQTAQAVGGVAVLVDGWEPAADKPFMWQFPEKKNRSGALVRGAYNATLTNFSCQQNLMRVLVSLTNLTGEAQYKKVATDVTGYYFDHFQAPNGLLYWGGHRFVDMNTLCPVGADEKQLVHELKNVFPYYELMFEVRPEATKNLIRAIWYAHVYDWNTLEISRHGHFTSNWKTNELAHKDRPLSPAPALWNDAPFTPPAPYFETQGLSFLKAGNDLIYCAGMYAKYVNDPQQKVWMMRVIEQFVSARDPVSKLGAYQFSQPRKTAEPPSDENAPQFTFSTFGDRAQRNFIELEPNPDAPAPQHKVLEATLLLSGEATTIYSENALMQMQLGKDLGASGQQIIDWTHEGLLAFQKYAYIPETNMLRPLITNATNGSRGSVVTDLSGYVLQRKGYYGEKGSVLKQYKARNTFLLSYARAYLITGDANLWTMARGIAKSNGLGDLGTEPGKNMALNDATTVNDVHSLFALIDIYEETKDRAYLDLARAVGNNIVKDRFITTINGQPLGKTASGKPIGYFMPGADYRFANFDALEPYALLALEAAIRGTPEKVPRFINGNAYTEGNYRRNNGTVVSTSDLKLFALKVGQEP